MAYRRLAREPKTPKPKQHTKQHGVSFVDGRPLIEYYAHRVGLVRLDPTEPKAKSFSFVSVVVNTCGQKPFVATDGCTYRRI